MKNYMITCMRSTNIEIHVLYKPYDTNKLVWETIPFSSFLSIRHSLLNSVHKTRT